MRGSSRPPIVVLGMMTMTPVAGVVWQTMHYVVGFKRLGYDVHYVETHARTPSMLMRHEDDDGGALAAAFIETTMRCFGLGDSWAYVALHDDGRHYGMTRRCLHRLYHSAGAILNLHGGTEPLPEFADTGRLVYVETDPMQLQVELHHQLSATTAFLEPHCAFFTFAENLGGMDCGLPVSERFSFQPTRQPVVADLWEVERPPSSRTLTTIGNWRQHWRDVAFEGNLYTWSKHEEFLKFLDLPRVAGSRFELALSSYEDSDRRMLEERGWRVRHALDLSSDVDTYREYIADSWGEFTAAKEQNVRLRTGWFSDRSATYLASARPVITQETGFSNVLPTGEGLFGFETVDEVLTALERIDGDYARASRAAAEIGREHFGHDVVLGRMLEELGLSPRRHPLRRESSASGFPDDMVLTPISRRPTVLPNATIDAVLSPPVPALEDGFDRRAPLASVVVVSFDNLVFTRMCLESLLGHTEAPAHEVVVVDNGSQDGSPEYLLELAEGNGRVKPVLNSENRGFPAACNQGLAAARGEALVLLNNDTVVAPCWLDGLVSHLSDRALGLIGPVTNRSGGESEIPTSYETYGEFLAFAAERRQAQRGRVTDASKLTMFCLAMRRETYAALGPLDERYAVGMFEDDDYSVRAQRAGLRLGCAEDVFVHHFGEASFGALAPTGEYGRAFHENRRRFEGKWGRAWRPHERRPDADYERLRARVRSRIEEHVPAGAVVLVVAKGDDGLLELVSRDGWHFPRAADGAYAGHYPADSHAAIDHLEELHSRGARYFVLPATALWWLDHYREFRQHLERRYPLLLCEDETCLIFGIGEDDRCTVELPATAGVRTGMSRDELSGRAAEPERGERPLDGGGRPWATNLEREGGRRIEEGSSPAAVSEEEEAAALCEEMGRQSARLAAQEERLEELERRPATLSGLAQDTRSQVESIDERSERVVEGLEDVGAGPGPRAESGSASAWHERYGRVVAVVGQIVRDKVPPGATVAIVSKGDGELLKLGDRKGLHFPHDDRGTSVGHHPADSAEAVAMLERTRARGAEFLLFPATALWWLDHYEGLARHLRRRYRSLDVDETCAIFDLRRPPEDPPATEGLDMASLQRGLHQEPAEVLAEISPNDAIFRPNPNRGSYFAAGLSALRCIELALLAAGRTEVGAILDLPCGHGRILRMLAAAFPFARLTACDLDRNGVDFCAAALGATPVYSADDPFDVEFGERFDLIWCGSLLTHLSAERGERFLRRFESLLAPGGVLVFSSHGLHVADRLRRRVYTYGLPEDLIEELLAEFERAPFAYRDYAGARDYGISLARPSFVVSQIERNTRLRLVGYTERAWNRHHDIVACVLDEVEP